jgi:hypothetical protein
MLDENDPKWDAPLSQAQWEACQWMFEPERDRLAALLADEPEAAAA